MVAPPPPVPVPPPVLTGADLFAVLIFMGVFILVVGATAILVEHKAPGLGSILHLSAWLILAVWWGMRNPDVRFDVGRAVFVLLFGLPFMVGFAYFARYAVSHSPLVLSEELRSEESEELATRDEERRRLVGQHGLTVSPLRPAGKIQIGDRMFDVVSGAGWIEEGEAVAVVREIDGEIVVERTARPDAGAKETGAV